MKGLVHTNKDFVRFTANTHILIYLYNNTQQQVNYNYNLSAPIILTVPQCNEKNNSN